MLLLKLLTATWEAIKKAAKLDDKLIEYFATWSYKHNILTSQQISDVSGPLTVFA
jgi:hypothetical protein